ncbi:SPOR domain-containing protein [Rothia aerolata]|uniref:SPOR domain-containing protein n=1 Tax=Rothia aerolata TaxID=1812262 RepID=A0A917IKQ1_9MICC|nr:SPOR domain-containing protein [Rothia aerolata]GGH56569.1 hypothetical protein GCM10007359_00810 [Rothia aerolata]
MSLSEYTPGPHDPQFWYNLTTGEVEEGQQSRSSQLWGPFATREEAENAMKTAAKRNEEWDNDGWNS